MSVYSAVDPDKVIHLYFYSCSDPQDPDVEAWASGYSGHFELILPDTWERQRQSVDRTPRKGDGNRKRGPKHSPILPSPAKDDNSGGGALSTEQRQRIAKNKKRAEVSVVHACPPRCRRRCNMCRLCSTVWVLPLV